MRQKILKSPTEHFVSYLRLLLKKGLACKFIKKMLKSSFSVANGLLTAALLACSVQAIHFDCTFLTLTPIVGTRYSCLAEVINSGSSSLDNVTGIHDTGRSNDDVGFLLILDQNVPFVPEGIAEFFKNLDVLVIDSSSLMTISANDLRPFPGLLYLQLYDNQLASLDGDLFTHTPQLQAVFFSQNRIEHIGHDLVTNLNNLTTLFFTNNICINTFANTRALVISLAPFLSVLCPPLDVTTTEATTTTEITSGQCLCDEEVGEIRELNLALGIQVENLQASNVEQNNRIEQQSIEIEQLQGSNEQLIEEIAALAERLLEIEILLGVGRMA